MKEHILNRVKLIALVLILSFSGSGVNQALAHRDGCHSWHSCPSDTGSYVCGDRGYYSECPSQPPAPTPTPQPQLQQPPPPPPPPVVTKTTTSKDIPIPFTKETRQNSNEYTDYSRLIQVGKLGVSRQTSEVTITGTSETGRHVTDTKTITDAAPEIIEVGSRTKPKADITGTTPSPKGWFSSNKGLFDIVGKFEGGKSINLYQGGNKIASARTASDGSFKFKKIKLAGSETKLAVFEKISTGWFSSHDNVVSEPTFILGAARAIETEYERSHKGTLDDSVDTPTDATHKSSTSTPVTAVQAASSPTAGCNQSLWSHVYHAYRLKVIEACKAVTGVITIIRKEPDGDYHILLNPDPEFAGMINAKNVSGEHGYLVLEPVCVNSVTQTDAVSSCASFHSSVTVPPVGTHVRVLGAYVLDVDHGWNEIHPVSSITQN